MLDVLSSVYSSVNNISIIIAFSYDWRINFSLSYTACWMFELNIFLGRNLEFYKRMCGIFIVWKTAPYKQGLYFFCVQYSGFYSQQRQLLCFVCLFGIYHPTREFNTHMETSPFPVKGCKFLTSTLTELSSEGSLVCLTYCDMKHLFIMVISEDPWHSLIAER